LRARLPLARVFCCSTKVMAGLNPAEIDEIMVILAT